MAESDRTHQALVRLLGTRLTRVLLAETVPSFLVARDGRTVLYANNAGATLLGLAEADPDHPSRIADGAPGSIRLAAICDDLSTAGPRLERLRFFSGMRGIALTALCRRIILLNGDAAVLASAIPQTRALSSEMPLVAQDDLQSMIVEGQADDRKFVDAKTGSESSSDPMAANAAAAASLTSSSPPLARITAPERFVFALDNAGLLTRLSKHFEEEVGAENTPRTGENLAEFVTRFDRRAADQLTAGIAGGETWEGISLNWPVGDGGSLAPVELSALPILDEQSRISGYSGFGKLRMQARFDAPPQGELEDNLRADIATSSHDPFSPLDSGQPTRAHETLGVEPDAIENDDLVDQVRQAIQDDSPALPAEPAAPADDTSSPSKIVSIKTGQATTGYPGFQRHGLSSTERNAFREIAKALGAKMEGQDELDPATQDRPANDIPAHAPSEQRQSPRMIQDNAAADDAPLVADDSDLLDRLPIGLLVLAGDQPLFVNRTLLDLTGYPDQMAFAARDGARAIFRKSNRPNAEADGINTMVLSTVDGEMIPVDSLLQRVNWRGRNATLISFRRAVELEQGKALRSVALDLKRARTEGDELRAILNTATDGVITLDGAGAILSMNGSAEALFGVYANEAVGEPLISLLHRDSHAEALDYLDGLKRNGVRSVLNDGRDVFGREKKGGRIPLFMTLGRISEEDPPRYCAVLRDLTAWKRAEADLTEARRAAEAASAKKSDFLAKISHEIRTPMNAIIGFSEVIQEERLGPLGNPKYREYLGDIQTSGRHVVSLVNDLLDLAKIEAGRMELDFAATDLNAVVTSAVAIIQPQANSNRILIRSQLAPALPPVVADERAMRQILLNMLSNATRFTESGGQVIVATTLLETGEAVIRIRDTGIGMTSSEIEQAMEPFRQVGTRRNTGGTGLGLPLTKALVEANRAAFAIRSTPGEGTLVEVTFPSTRVLAE